jgi:hypothetical protein
VLQGGCVLDHDLSAPSGRANRLEAKRSPLQQPFTGTARIVKRERRIAAQHDILHTMWKFVRPSGRRLRAVVDQRMRDRLGRDERMRHHAAEQIAFAANPERMRLFRAEGIVGNEIARARARRGGIMIAAEREALHGRQLLRDFHMRRALVLIPIFGRRGIEDHVPV